MPVLHEKKKQVGLLGYGVLYRVSGTLLDSFWGIEYVFLSFWVPM